MQRGVYASLLTLEVLFCLIIGVVLDDEVALILGPNPYTGLVQITHGNRTGLVCDDGFGIEAARVVCRQLGYPTVNPVFQNASGFANLPANMNYILDDLVCQGSEHLLSECGHATWYDENCGKDETVAVFCEKNPCKTNLCKNGGTCHKVTADQFQCTCPQTFTGILCDKDVDECMTHNGACSHVCINEHGGFRCECPDVELMLSSDNHSCVAAGETVTCSSQTMTITFDKSRFPGLRAQYVTLDDPTCHATQNATHIIVTSPLDTCGTTSKIIGTKIVYGNTVKSREVIVDGVISRVREIDVPFQCIVPMAETIEVALKVDKRVLTFSAESRGHFDTRLELFHDKNLVIPAREKPFFVDPGDNVHAQVSIFSNGSDLTPFSLRCDATPTQNTSYHVYSLVHQGCATDSSVQFLQAPHTSKAHIVFEAFKYLDGSPAVFLNCDVVVCLASDNSSQCAQGCHHTHPGRRSLVGEEDPDIGKLLEYSQNNGLPDDVPVSPVPYVKK